MIPEPPVWLWQALLCLLSLVVFIDLLNWVGNEMLEVGF